MPMATFPRRSGARRSEMGLEKSVFPGFGNKYRQPDLQAFEIRQIHYLFEIFSLRIATNDPFFDISPFADKKTIPAVSLPAEIVIASSIL
jgi:hypothetical protein